MFFSQTLRILNPSFLFVVTHCIIHMLCVYLLANL
ncbi:MAG: hypothetical protein DI535_03190 [Citrobacter freundii]|nr:MAG: hypothetical protein DI535_03190 [Citrobacter freundii]